MNFPIGLQNFEKIRSEGYVYVDKTRHIYELTHSGCYFFLSRPRRFGKSLLLSTLEAYFLGKKELFKGLAIEALEQEWKRYPVLYLDINSGNYTLDEEIGKILNGALVKWEREYGTDESETTDAMRFSGVIRRAYEKTGEKVVILIDEYDKPLLHTIEAGKTELHQKNRAILKAFYSVLKTCDGFIKFAILTGVTKFGKVSVFSDLNNLNDISMDERYTDICGMTEREIRDNFDESVGTLAMQNALTKAQCYEQLRRMYDGYHFRPDSEGIYNPFSVLSALYGKRFENYWFSTGTPTFLVDILDESNHNLEALTSRPVTLATLNGIDPIQRNPIGVIYQSGYLTIKDYDKESKLYTLDYPNVEVKEGFMEFLIPRYTSREEGVGVFYINEFRKALQDGDVEAFLKKLQTFFNEGDYHVVGQKELYFQNSISVIVRLLGIKVQTEMSTSRGRIDAVIQTQSYIYVIEMKLDGNADDALAQIETKGYAHKFTSDPRKLFKIGINFSSQTRGISEYKVAE